MAKPEIIAADAITAIKAILLLLFIAVKRLLDGAVHNLSKQNLIKVKAKTLKHVEDQLDIAEDEIVCE